MHQKNSHKNKRTFSQHPTNYLYSHDNSSQKPAHVKKLYIVSPQTAYHITELAMQENTTEGRIVDKIMRTYLASTRI